MTFQDRMAAISGLVGYWKCEEAGHPTDLADSSGLGHTMAWNAGVGGSNQVADGPRSDTGTGRGTNGTLSGWLAADSPDWDLTSAGTLLGWFRADPALADGPSYIFGRRLSPTDQNPYAITLSTGGAWVFRTYDGAGTAVHASTITPVAGTWGHLAVAWGSGRVKFYSNGVLATDVALARTPQVSAHVLGILRASTWPGMDIDFDELGIVNRAMTADEIAELFIDSRGFPPRFW